ncbi:hypothetical protein BDV98DRAFT_575143 [Pterulicium gracile]|uniref:Uncharacterized protein n=1 Tax=Pterulicium gracile TaxID=1884261 RepID=A0A5C3Q6C0_9AGAR|nr:hypothetical protein BDV98DRAFT_575143 [Pterula gracilis]
MTFLQLPSRRIGLQLSSNVLTFFWTYWTFQATPTVARLTGSLMCSSIVSAH